MVHQRKVAVVVDSSCCLPANLVRDWDITVAPHDLIIDGQHYRDGVDILSGDFYQILKNDRATLTTGPPKTQQFLEAFNEAAKLAPNVLCLTLSSSFSATYRVATLAKSEFDQGNDSGGGTGVEVMDSGAAAGAAGLIGLAAARCAAAGQTLDQVVAGVDRLAPTVNLLAFLDTLYYLGKGGRIGKFQSWVGSLLGIKPLAELRLGEARMLEKPRSRAKAISRLLDIMVQRVGSTPVIANVMEADAAGDAQDLLHEIKTQMNCCEAFISQFTPVMGANTGPGLLGVAFYLDTGDDPTNGCSKLVTSDQ